MRSRRKPKGEWIWEEVAALKRGRIEPETPAGEESLAAAARVLQGAMQVRVDPEREILSRARLLDALRDEPLPERVIVATHAPRALAMLALQVALPVAVALLLVAAAWRLPVPTSAAPPPVSMEVPETGTLCAGSLSVLRADTTYRDEWGERDANLPLPRNGGQRGTDGGARRGAQPAGGDGAAARPGSGGSGAGTRRE